jgi:N-acetylmuramoyl-L-alanine amidase
MHFHPQRYDGVADVETVARLDALLEKYQGKPRPVFTMPRLGQ